MGYSTDFTGKLEFTSTVTTEMLAKLNTFFGEDPDDHPDWGMPRRESGYIDLQLTKDFTGIEWNGAEKTRGMVETVNLIIREMKKTWPEFGLRGVLNAQGEDVDDRWKLVVANGVAQKVDVPIAGTKVQCPSCHHKFYVE